jgi:two-component sensor histidine kinase
VIAELVANAIRHSASGEDGGGLRVEITHEPGAGRVAGHGSGTAKPYGPSGGGRHQAVGQDAWWRRLLGSLVITEAT